MARTKKQTTDDLGSLLRAGMNVVGGALATKGYIAASYIEPLSGAALTLASIFLSMRKNKQNAAQ